MADGEYPLRVLGAIASQVRRLLSARQLLDHELARVWRQRMSYTEFQQRVPADTEGLPTKSPYANYLTLQRAERFTLSELKGFLRLIQQTDTRLKSSGHRPPGGDGKADPGICAARERAGRSGSRKHRILRPSLKILCVVPIPYPVVWESSPNMVSGFLQRLSAPLAALLLGGVPFRFFRPSTVRALGRAGALHGVSGRRLGFCHGSIGRRRPAGGGRHGSGAAPGAGGRALRGSAAGFTAWGTRPRATPTFWTSVPPDPLLQPSSSLPRWTPSCARTAHPNQFQGREVELTGRIKDDPKYGLEMILESPAQIEVLP